MANASNGLVSFIDGFGFSVISGRDDGKSAYNPPEKIEKKSDQGGRHSSGGWNSG